MKKESYILQLFEIEGGLIRMQDLVQKGISAYYIRKLLKNNHIERLQHGFYKLSKTEPDEYLTIKTHIPNGVVCMYSAWQFYNLTTYIPHQYHIAIERKSKIKLPAYPPIKLHYWNNSLLQLGQTETKVNDTQISISDLEKSVCDAVKFRNKIGKDTLQEILEEYLKRKDKNLDVLLKYAISMRIEKTLKTYLDVLL